jgi:hypothetical protein
MTAHIPGLVQAIQTKLAGPIYFFGTNKVTRTHEASLGTTTRLLTRGRSTLVFTNYIN